MYMPSASAALAATAAFGLLPCTVCVSISSIFYLFRYALAATAAFGYLSCRACVPISSIAAVAAAGDVLNISHAAGAGQPDLLLQLTGAEAVADAFRAHQAAIQQVSKAAGHHLFIGVLHVRRMVHLTKLSRCVDGTSGSQSTGVLKTTLTTVAQLGVPVKLLPALTWYTQPVQHPM
jgi:hypothetical protein